MPPLSERYLAPCGPLSQVPYTALIIFQTVTFDAWTDPMYGTMNSVSPFAFLYFVVIAILGGFFIVNLFLAVIFDEFMTALAVSSRSARGKRPACCRALPAAIWAGAPAQEHRADARS